MSAVGILLLQQEGDVNTDLCITNYVLHDLLDNCSSCLSAQALISVCRTVLSVFWTTDRPLLVSKIKLVFLTVNTVSPSKDHGIGFDISAFKVYC